jgi:hypothetical protein
MHILFHSIQAARRVPSQSNQLFLAWVDNHRKAVHLEDAIAQAAPGEGAAMERELAAVRNVAEQLLARAKAAFDEELRLRGLR